MRYIFDPKFDIGRLLPTDRALRAWALALGTAVLLVGESTDGLAAAARVSVDDSSFRCITDMMPVRHFYVGNLLGDVSSTVAVAKAGHGDYPIGSVLQLVPNEVMVKQQKGFSAATRDWEFFFIDVSASGSTIRSRGTTDVNNGVGLNCLACHSKARPEFDLVCEQDHGCASLPFTDKMFGALQRTDPRCNGAQPVSVDDADALREFDKIAKALTHP